MQALGRRGRRQQGPQEKGKDRRARVLGPAPSQGPLAGCVAGSPMASPVHLASQHQEGVDRFHATSGRATHSGDDSGVRLDISSGVGTVGTGGTGREGAVTTLPVPMGPTLGGIQGHRSAPPQPRLQGPWATVLTSEAETPLVFQTSLGGTVGLDGWAVTATCSTWHTGSSTPWAS